MIIGDGMTSEEKEVLIEMLYNREAVLAWDFPEMGKVKKEVAPFKKFEQLIIKLGRFPGFRFLRP